MSPTPDEIAKIEHELDILRSRYAIFQRWARVAKWFFGSLALISLAAGVGYGTAYDPLPTAIVLIAAIVVVGIAVVVGGAIDRIFGLSPLRWIDIISPSPMSSASRISEAGAIEVMIADREARLAELKRHPT